jgi:hypothetical protein
LRQKEYVVNFLCVVYVEEGVMAGLSPEEQATLDKASQAYDELLQRRGSYLDAQALHSPKRAKTVRKRNKHVTITDGPFAETREQLAGFILIDVADMDQAVAIAADIPMASLGAVEVRPIYEF